LYTHLAGSQLCKAIFHLQRLQRSAIQFLHADLFTQQKVAYAAQIALLEEIPGVDWTLAAVIVCQTGRRHECLPEGFLARFLGGSLPGNNESAGKRKSTKIPKGNVYLKSALVEASNAAGSPSFTCFLNKSPTMT